MNINSLYIDNRIQYRNSGLYSLKQIQKNSILMQINRNDTICQTTLPQSYKQIMHTILKITTKQQLKVNNNILIDQEQQLLIIYLIYLKLTLNKHCQLVQKWLTCSTQGFIAISENIIRDSGQQSLLYDYLAYKIRLRQHSQYWYFILQQYLRNADQNSEYIILLSLNKEQFAVAYRWGQQFKNTRSFGYTSKTTMIPYIDFMNYSIEAQHKINFEILKNNNKDQLNNYQQEQIEDNYSDQSEQEQQCNINILKYQNNIQINESYRIINRYQLKLNEQICFHYGRLNNNDLLKYYGFALSNNPFDSFMIYYTPYSEIKIRFDPIERPSNKLKLKHNKISNKLINLAKKFNYFHYYGKQPSKVLWSIPEDLQFEIFCFENIISAMKKSKPPKIQFNQQTKSSHQLQHIRYIRILQQEHQNIYDQQIIILDIILNSLLQIFKISTKHEKQNILSNIALQRYKQYHGLQQYLNLLFKIMIKQ